VTGEEALAIFARAIVREMMAGGEKRAQPKRTSKTEPTTEDDAPPQPRFDFTPESDPEYQRRMQAELDRINGTESTAAKAKAERLRERQYPEDLPMRGLVGDPDL